MKSLLQILILVTIIASCEFFVWVQYPNLNNIKKIPDTPTTVVPTTTIIPQTLIELSIESINVHTQIESVGVIDNTNKMAVPADPNNVGWYNLGTYPGDIGSAVFRDM